MNLPVLYFQFCVKCPQLSTWQHPLGSQVQIFCMCAHNSSTEIGEIGRTEEGAFSSNPKFKIPQKCVYGLEIALIDDAAGPDLPYQGGGLCA